MSPISLPDHTAIGALLWQMHDDLTLITNVVGPAYGAAMCDRAGLVYRKIDAVLSSLDHRFCAEHSDASPYSWPQGYMERPRDERAIVRQMATTVIEPALEYEPPRDWCPSRNGHLTGPLQFREHLVIGKLLYQMRVDLMDLFINRLQYAYGKSHRTCQRVRAAQAKLDSLRAVLDSKVCGEYPQSVRDVECVAITKVYYGWDARAISHVLEAVQ